MTKCNSISTVRSKLTVFDERLV